MADTPNQTLDRRREERAAQEMMQDTVNRLSNITIDGMEVFQKIMNYQASFAYYIGDALNAQGASINQMITSVQNGRNNRTVA